MGQWCSLQGRGTQEEPLDVTSHKAWEWGEEAASNDPGLSISTPEHDPWEGVNCTLMTALWSSSGNMDFGVKTWFCIQA